MLNFTNNNPDELLKRGTQFHNAGNFEGAEQAYRQVLANEPNHPGANNLLGLVALQTNHPRDAAELFRKAIGERPEFAAAHTNLASALAAMGRNDEAILHYRLASELDPDFAPSRQQLSVLMTQLGRPPFPDPDPDFASPLAQYAGVLAGRNRAVPAIRLYERSLSHNPEQPDLLEPLAELQLRAEQWQKAVNTFRRALAHGCQTAAIYHGLGKALHRTFEFTPAREACNRAAQLEPDNMDIQWTLTQIQADIHKFETAIRNIMAAIEKDPNNMDLRRQLEALSRPFGGTAVSKAS